MVSGETLLRVNDEFLGPGALTRIVGIYASDEIDAEMSKFRYAAPGLLGDVAPMCKGYLRHLFRIGSLVW